MSSYPLLCVLIGLTVGCVVGLANDLLVFWLRARRYRVPTWMYLFLPAPLAAVVAFFLCLWARALL